MSRRRSYYHGIKQRCEICGNLVWPHQLAEPGGSVKETDAVCKQCIRDVFIDASVFDLSMKKEAREDRASRVANRGLAGGSSASHAS